MLDKKNNMQDSGKEFLLELLYERDLEFGRILIGKKFKQRGLNYQK